ncbi:MAG: tetratricopeptide repeat protein [Thermodesulfobacteriota bacterium]
MDHRKALVLGGVIALILAAALPSLAVTPYDDVLVQRAIQNIQLENYDEALAELTEAWEKGTKTPEKAFLLGQVYRLMLNYPQARKHLEEALRLKPGFHPAQLMLADTLIALDKPKEAVPLLQSLEASGFEAGQTAFLLGITATKEGKYSEALDYFNKAKADPKMAQEATFQASLALAALNRVKEAQKSMEESIALNPQSQTADFAKRYMGVLAERAETLRPFHITVSAGYDYDSNISVAPSSAGEVTTISGKGGSVFTQTALMEYTLFPAGPFSLLGQYSYFQNFHPTVQGFDIMSHFLGLTPTYGFKNGRFWFPASYTYMDLSSEKYYTGFLFTPTYLHLFTENIGGEVGARYNRQYYTSPVFFDQDNRSGKAYGGSLGLYYFFKKQKGFFQARISYEHNATTGSNWDSSAYRFLLAALWPITDKWKYNLFLDIIYQPFDHVFYNGETVGNVAGAPLLPQWKRMDKILILGMNSSYEFLKGLEFGIHWYYIRDNSNINLYNYSRHIVGCQFAYRY